MTVSLTLRNTKGSALTFTEMDTNLQNLANAASTADTFLSGNLTTQGLKTISADVLGLTSPLVFITDNASYSSIVGHSTSAADAAVSTGGLAFMIGGDPALNAPNTMNAVFVPSVASAYQSNTSILGHNIAQQAGWGNVYLGVTNSTTGGFYQFSNVGLKFVDGTVQSTAATPFTGGSLTSNLNLQTNYISNAIFTNLREAVSNVGVTSGAVTVNANVAPYHIVVANGNITINTNNITNLNVGQSVTIKIRQDATGSRLLTSNILYAGGSKTLSTAANSMDTITVFYDGVHYLGSLVKGYA